MLRLSCRVVVIVVAACSLAMTHSAAACSNSVWNQGSLSALLVPRRRCTPLELFAPAGAHWECSNPTPNIRHAEALLQQGVYGTVTALLGTTPDSEESVHLPFAAVFVRGEPGAWTGWTPRLVRRAAELRIKVRLRSERDVDPVTRAFDRARVVEWMLTSPDSPALRALLAETLAGSDRATARALLEALVARDLMPDPAAWSVLARLRDGDGDHRGARQARRYAPRRHASR